MQISITGALRRSLAISSLLLASSLGHAQQAGTSPVKIFILAGQSNMLGTGEISPSTTEGTLEYIATPTNDPNGDYAFLGSPGSWVVRDDVWIRDQDGDLGGLTPGYGAQTSLVGPELGFGHFVGDLQENQIIIVKTAWGGKDLANDFRPPSSGGTTGFYYNEILRLVTEMTDNLDTDPSTYFPDYDFAGGYEIAGFGWHQGWNDRVDTGRSAEYETNMANFIRDIRTDLGVPGMPFVIATTGMDGGPTYSTVELAQLEMANTTKYPEFAGNVAVVDTRITYDGMDFWQPVANSPADQGFHWNRNAKTYVNIGLAMGDAMSTLSPARCPFRLRGSGGPSGVTLTWQNGSEIPTSVRVLRNSVEIAAAAPSNPASFTDATAVPGIHDYELQFTMPGDPCDPLTLTFNTGITDLEAFRSPGGISLSWTNNLSYSGIEVTRNGSVIEASLSGTATSYIDAAPPSSGTVTYGVRPTNGSAAATEIQIDLDGPPSGNALIYEPFDYTVGGLNLQGGSEAGLDGTWFANGTTQVTAGSLSFEALPVGGAKLSDFTSSQNRFGGSRAILPSALAANGLLDHGAELWFSFITGVEAGANRTNSRLAVALAAGPFGGGNVDYFISGGTGVGFDMSAGVPRAASFPADTGGSSRASNNSPQYEVSEFSLIVGKITWGADASSPDTIELFKPGNDLALPASPISTHTVVVDQSTYDTLTFRRGDRPLLDEIRFGQSYNDVIGADLIAPDNDPPTPNPLTWASLPAAAGDSQVTMTATTAVDPGGVEYYFEETSGNPGGSDSGWQNSATYTDDGLNSATSYSYRVKARDKSSNANETGWSSIESATTDVPDILPPTPSPMTWDSVPTAISTSEVTMTATIASDPSGVEYYFTETTGNPGGDDSGWQDNPTYIDNGLNPATTYAYTVTARDKSSANNVGAPSTPAVSVTTPDVPSGSGGAVLYEPFDYDSGNIADQDGGTGFNGAWSNTRNSPQASYPGKTWGSLTVAGGYAR
ncbi:MAG: sialate O-acetylesterase, partial [Haloferula sp.]